MLYITRHGLTDWNARRKLQGRTDVPLNDDGREMARRAAKEYADIHLDVCYCSPLKRARETAEIILEGKSVPIIFDERLIEMSFGEYEGLENSFEIPDCPINTLFWEPEKYKAIGGAESFEELFERTGAFIDEVVFPQLNEGKDILIVGHGAMNCSIISRIRKLPMAEFWKGGLEQCKLLKLL